MSAFTVGARLRRVLCASAMTSLLLLGSGCVAGGGGGYADGGGPDLGVDYYGNTGGDFGYYGGRGYFVGPYRERGFVVRGRPGSRGWRSGGGRGVPSIPGGGGRFGGGGRGGHR